jgi:hypothetical protein
MIKPKVITIFADTPDCESFLLQLSCRIHSRTRGKGSSLFSSGSQAMSRCCYSGLCVSLRKKEHAALQSIETVNSEGFRVKTSPVVLTKKDLINALQFSTCCWGFPLHFTRNTNPSCVTGIFLPLLNTHTRPCNPLRGLFDQLQRNCCQLSIYRNLTHPSDACDRDLDGFRKSRLAIYKTKL